MRTLLALVMAVVLAPVFANAADAAHKDDKAAATTEAKEEEKK